MEGDGELPAVAAKTLLEAVLTRAAAEPLPHAPEGSLPRGPTHCTYAVRVHASGVPYVARTMAYAAQARGGAQARRRALRRPAAVRHRHRPADGAAQAAQALAAGARAAAHQHAQTGPLACSASARLLCLRRACLAALGSSARPGRGRLTGRPTTASGARASRLQSCRFHCV